MSDTPTINHKILLFVPPTDHFIWPKLDLAVSNDQKAKRDWNDSQCSSLLIPPRLYESFFSNPMYVTITLCTSTPSYFSLIISNIMAKIWNLEIKIHASKFPSFLYANAAKFNPKKPYCGLYEVFSLFVYVIHWHTNQFSSTLLSHTENYLGLLLHFHRSKYCNEEGCKRLQQISSWDPWNHTFGVFWDRLCCSLGKSNYFSSPYLPHFSFRHNKHFPPQLGPIKTLILITKYSQTVSCYFLRMKRMFGSKVYFSGGMST